MFVQVFLRETICLLYFLIYLLTDLPNTIVNSEIFFFADDAKLMNIARTQQDAINLQSDVDNLQM